MSQPKQRVRLYAAGQTMYRLVRPDKGYGGPYGQTRQPAKWACIHCAAIVDGTDDAPGVRIDHGIGIPEPHRYSWANPCARNGHAPCAHCGKILPRTDDGCPRAHNWRNCPGKTEAHRMIPQHAAARHQDRCRP